MKILSLFSGIGAFEKALNRLGEPLEIVNYCEIDKYASKAYSLIHNVSEDLNLRDVTKVDTSELPNDIDLVTYGFPCQDISLAGKQRGFKDENGNRTRSGLFFEALRIIQDAKPKYAIAENVKALTSEKFKKEFGTVLYALNEAGYNNYWKVLNAKDFGIPQNRERVFIVSIRKDLDTCEFQFPQKMPLKLHLKDVLEKNVDESYYLSDEQVQKIYQSSYNKERGRIQDDDVCDTLLARDFKGQKVISEENTDLCNTTRLGNKEVSNSVRVGGRGSIDRHSWDLVSEPTIAASRGKLSESENWEQKLELNGDGTSNTLTGVQKDNFVIEPNIGHNPVSKKLEFDGFRTDVAPCLIATDCKAPKCTMEQDFRIRKLTPKECWRLMGFDDSDIDKCLDNGISKSQLYKMAGNSIVVDVLEHIFKSLMISI